MSSLLSRAQPAAEETAATSTAASVPADDATTTPAAPADDASLYVLRDRLRAFAKERDWDQFHTPRNICLALVGEVGELCECFQWRGDAGAPLGLPNWEAKKRDALSDELADVLLYLIRLADKCDVDVSPRRSRTRV